MSNHKRSHSSPGYLTPAEFEQRWDEVKSSRVVAPSQWIPSRRGPGGFFQVELIRRTWLGKDTTIHERRNKA